MGPSQKQRSRNYKIPYPTWPHPPGENQSNSVPWVTYHIQDQSVRNRSRPSGGQKDLDGESPWRPECGVLYLNPSAVRWFIISSFPVTSPAGRLTLHERVRDAFMEFDGSVNWRLIREYFKITSRRFGGTILEMTITLVITRVGKIHRLNSAMERREMKFLLLQLILEN